MAIRGTSRYSTMMSSRMDLLGALGISFCRKTRDRSLTRTLLAVSLFIFCYGRCRYFGLDWGGVPLGRGRCHVGVISG